MRGEMCSKASGIAPANNLVWYEIAYFCYFFIGCILFERAFNLERANYYFFISGEIFKPANTKNLNIRKAKFKF